ncbi:secreted protein [gut metagenome]|uniref:Secreted protein n=1 Tax=gut metagenome TaxID=749906 RepID=J9GH55_9ZZZZ
MESKRRVVSSPSLAATTCLPLPSTEATKASPAART